MFDIAMMEKQRVLATEIKHNIWSVLNPQLRLVAILNVANNPYSLADIGFSGFCQVSRQKCSRKRKLMIGSIAFGRWWTYLDKKVKSVGC